MTRFFMGVLATLVIGVALGAAAVYSGTLDVAADTPHSRLVYQIIETAREQSIDRHARDLAVPANLADTERIRRGAGNYAAMCAACHLAPGKADSEIRMGLYPEPPDLARPEEETVAEMAARHFWIIKHGIKASGMPAWSRGGIEDAAIWDLVAFIQKVPSLSAEQYVALVESSEGHSHGGLLAAEAGHPDEAHMPSPGNADSHEHSHSGGHEH
ncbi:MAG: c-type cytochrome [Thiobacillus sp.]